MSKSPVFLGGLWDMPGRGVPGSPAVLSPVFLGGFGTRHFPRFLLYGYVLIPFFIWGALGRRRPGWFSGGGVVLIPLSLLGGIWDRLGAQWEKLEIVLIPWFLWGFGTSAQGDRRAAGRGLIPVFLGGLWTPLTLGQSREGWASLNAPVFLGSLGQAAEQTMLKKEEPSKS
jgi:hypothetical protein